MLTIEYIMTNNLSSFESKIILTNSLTTARRFVQKQNLLGVDVLNYATHTMHSLIQESLFLCGNTSRVVSSHESAYILLKRIENKDDGFGLKETVKSIGASLKLLEVLDDYRLNDKDDYLALEPADYKGLLKDYKQYLDNKGLIDYAEALRVVSSLKRKEIIYLMSDVSLRPLEQKVLNQIFDGVLTIDVEPHDINVIKNYEVYGQYGELLNALNYIEDKEIPLGDIEIIYTDSIFENLIKGTCDARRIPYILKSNHGKTTNLVSFIYDVLDYFSQDFKYELLEKVLSNLGLNPLYLKEFYQTISFPKYIVGSSLRRSKEFLIAYQGSDKITHFYNLFESILDVIEEDNHKLKLDYLKLLNVATEYLSCDKEKLVLGDKLTSLNNIIQHEDDFLRKIDLIMKELDAVTYSEKDNPNCLSFSPINKSFTMRPYIIVIGLNQNLLIGSDVENAFIKDIDKYIEDFKDDDSAHISANYRKRQISNLKYYLSHSDSQVIFSHSSDNKIDLRDMTDGTYLFNIDNLPNKEVVNAYDIENNPIKFNKTTFGNEEEMEQDYDNGEYKEVEGKDIKDPLEEDNPDEIKEVVETKNFTLSPSALKDLMECPLRFYYQKIMGIISVQYPELDESVWLEANSKGTYFHEVMQIYFNNFINKNVIFDDDLFEKAFEKATEEAIKKNPINNQYITEKEIKDLKVAARNYLKIIISRDFSLYKVLSNEAKLTSYEFTYPKCKTLFFSGDVDRVDGYISERVLHLRIVDYKTGRYHNKDDHGYYQHVLYSYILEQVLNKPETPKLLGLDYDKVFVDKFIYAYPLDELGRENRYLRDEFDETSSDYKNVMDTIDTFVISYLNKEKNYLKNAVAFFDENHEIADKDRGKTCNYCRYKKECIKRVNEGYKTWKPKGEK